jgi:hypothetical protein
MEKARLRCTLSLTESHKTGGHRHLRENSKATPASALIRQIEVELICACVHFDVGRKELLLGHYNVLRRIRLLFFLRAAGLRQVKIKCVWARSDFHFFCN